MPAEPRLAEDEIYDIREALANSGFDVGRINGQSVTYRAPNGERFKVVVSKLRGR